MGKIERSVVLLALLVGAGALAAGCGGGEATGQAEPVAKQERLYPWLKGPSREFLIRGGDNAVQTFGREATKAEREQASYIIHAWMRARAAQDWARDCSYFSKQQIHQLITTDAMVV